MNNIKKEEECTELKNIKYKTLLQSGKSLNCSFDSNSDFDNLQNFLEKESETSKNEPWVKLNKTNKMEKIKIFAKKYKNENNLSDLEGEMLVNYLDESIDKKRLSKMKDVEYNKEKGEILRIPGLIYHKQNKKFTIKNLDSKRTSTSKSLSLPNNVHSKNKTCRTNYND